MSDAEKQVNDVFDENLSDRRKKPRKNPIRKRPDESWAQYIRRMERDEIGTD